MAQIIKEEEDKFKRNIKLIGPLNQEETYKRLKELERIEQKQISADQEIAENIINQL
jgi:hypothetical protein